MLLWMYSWYQADVHPSHETVGRCNLPPLCSCYLLRCTCWLNCTVWRSKSDSITTEPPTHITTVPVRCLCKSVHQRVQMHSMTAPAAKPSFLTLKGFSSCSHMKGSSRSGTHDGGIIPAMYNSPTAGSQHVCLCSQVGRQASLSNWHLMLVMCKREGGGSSVGWWVGLLHMCVFG